MPDRRKYVVPALATKESTSAIGEAISAIDLAIDEAAAAYDNLSSHLSRVLVPVPPAPNDVVRASDPTPAHSDMAIQLNHLAERVHMLAARITAESALIEL